MKTAARKTRKSGHVSIVYMPLADLQPAKLNDQIYRPVDPGDPEVRTLADSIREIGLKTPLVATRDNVILSGHRRRVACQLAGVMTVPVQYESILSTDPAFPKLLVEHNRQRVKSLDEQLREEVVCADPEEAYRVLTEHRRKLASVEVNPITIQGHKRRAAISAAKKPFVEAIRRILDKRRNFWPLSDRQIHYALLNDPPLIHASKPGSRYANNLKCYKALCELLTRAGSAAGFPSRQLQTRRAP